MATHNFVRPQKKLSSKLSFFLALLGVVFVVICVWQLSLVEFSSDGTSSDQQVVPAYKFGERGWLTFLATTVGVFTWFGTTLVTIRNSIKQHTITTLLQMRLSATYMEHANKVASALAICREKANPPWKHPTKTELLNGFLLPDGSIDPKGELSLRYVLNYFEFLAIGIARGDFDEEMLYDSLSSILENNIKITRAWIEEKRQADPELYCHLEWLFKKWCPDALQLIERSQPLRRKPSF